MRAGKIDCDAIDCGAIVARPTTAAPTIRIAASPRLFMRFLVISRCFALSAALCLAQSSDGLTAERPARIANPGEVVRLAVRDAEPGAVVRFVLPDSGPSGAFADGSITTEITASASGAAEALFTTGPQPGPLLADAVVASTRRRVSFAVTIVTEDAEPPAVSAEQALAAAGRSVEPGEALHGPVLVEAGTEVRGPAPPVIFDHNVPFATADRVWLAWVDTEPESRFGHLTKWVLINAESGAARTIHQDWWPELRSPGLAQAVSLLGASRSNSSPLTAEPPTAAGQETGGACYLGVAGARLPGAREDASGLADYLVSTGQVSAQDVRIVQSVGAASDALEQLAAQGCDRLSLLISAHAGQARGGGILLGPGGEYVTYARLAEWLAAFAQVEAVMAVSFAAEAAKWLDGRGFSGVVLPSSPAESAAPLDTVQRLLTAAGSGGLTLTEAHRAASMMEPILITPDGHRLMWLSDVDIHDAGGEQRIDVTRPLNIDLGPTLIYNAQSGDEDTLGIQTKVFVLPSDQDFLRFTFGGRRRGEASYQIATNDSSQQIYAANGRVQIGSFTLAPDGVALRAGSVAGVRQRVAIQRHGYWLRRGAPATFVITSRDESIVRVAESRVETATAEAAFELVAAGPGRTFVDVRDLTADNTATVEVQVLGAADSNCPVEGSARVAFAIAAGGDPGGIAPRVALNNGAIFWKREGGRIRIWGDKAPIISAEGTVTAACAFSAEGDSGQERVAGETGLAAAYRNGRIVGGAIEFDYTLGPFESGGAVTYAGAGPTALPSGLLGSAVLLAPQTGGEQTVAIGVAPGTAWTASSDSDWIRLVSQETGTGPAIFRLLITPNGTSSRRLGAVTLAGETVTVTQAAGPDLDEPLVVAVLNGANFQEGVASAGWLTIAGFGLAPETQVWFTEPAAGASQTGGPLPTELAGVSVAVNGRPAYVQFVSPRQINVLAPTDPTTGRVQVRVRNNGRVSAPFTVAKQSVAPELFRFTPREGRYPAAVHPDGELAGRRGLFRTQSTRPARPGDAVLLFGSGFGPTTPATPTGLLVTQPAPLAQPVVASVGGLPAQVLFGGLVGSGLYQFNLVVPELPPGEHRVELWIAGRSLETTAYLTVE